MNKTIFAIVALFVFQIFTIQPALSAEKGKAKAKKATAEDLYKEKIIEKAKLLYETDDLEEIVFRLETEIRAKKEAEDNIDEETSDLITKLTTSNSDEDSLANGLCEKIANIGLDSYNMFASGEKNESVKAKIFAKYTDGNLLFSQPQMKEMISKMVDTIEEQIKTDGDVHKQEKIIALAGMIDIDRVLFAQFKSSCIEGSKQAIDALLKQ